MLMTLVKYYIEEVVIQNDVRICSNIYTVSPLGRFQLKRPHNTAGAWEIDPSFFLGTLWDKTC